MPEPLGIATAVISLLKTTWTVGVELKKFHDGVSTISKTLRDLENDVDGLARVLVSMRDTFETITAANGSGDLTAHWTNVARAIDDGNGIIRELREELQDISKTTRMLDASRKQLRLNFAEDKLASLRTRVHSLRDTLQLSLQVIAVANQNSQQGTLTELSHEIRRLAKMFNDTIESRHTAAQSQQDEAHIAVMIDFRECVRSAASIVSSASTAIMSQDGDNDGNTVIMSDFGDCFPVEHNLAIRRWMAASSVQGYEHGRSSAPPQSVVDVFSVNESADSSDSEVDLEDEITTTLLEDGQQKLSAGKLKDAERVLKMCSSRLSNVTWEQRGGHATKQFSKHAEVLQSLFVIYYQQENWSEAQTILTQKLNVEDRMHRTKDVAYMRDVSALAKILQRRGDTIQALLHARRALKGFKKLQSVKDIRSCLELLIELCSAKDVGDDAEIYSLMLSKMQREVSISVEESPRSAALPQPRSSAPTIDRSQEDEGGCTGRDQKLDNILEGEQEDPAFQVLGQMRERDGDQLPHEIRPDPKTRPKNAKFRELLFSDEETQEESRNAQPSYMTDTDESLQRPAQDIIEGSTVMLQESISSAQDLEGSFAHDNSVIEHTSSSGQSEAPVDANGMSNRVNNAGSYHLADPESKTATPLYYVTSRGLVRNKRQATSVTDILDEFDNAHNQAPPVSGSITGERRQEQQPVDQRSGLTLEESGLSTSLINLSVSNNTSSGPACGKPTLDSLLEQNINQSADWNERGGALQPYAKGDPRWWDHHRPSDEAPRINEQDIMSITSADDANTSKTSPRGIDPSLGDDDISSRPSGAGQPQYLISHEPSRENRGVAIRSDSHRRRSDEHNFDPRPITPSPFMSRRSSSSSTQSGFFAGKTTSTASDIASPASTNMTIPSLDRDSVGGSARRSQRFVDQWTWTDNTPSRQSRQSHLDNQQPVSTSKQPWTQGAASSEDSLTSREPATLSYNELAEPSVGPESNMSPSALVSDGKQTWSHDGITHNDPPAGLATSPTRKNSISATAPKLDAHNLAKVDAEPYFSSALWTTTPSVVSVAGTDATVSTEVPKKTMLESSSTRKPRIAHVVLVGDGMCGKTSLIQKFGGQSFGQWDIGHHHGTVPAKIDGENIEIDIYDAPGQEGHGMMYKYASSADCILLCFALDFPTSLENLMDKWIYHLPNHGSNKPILLVGCKSDLRDNPEAMKHYPGMEQRLLSTSECNAARKKIGAFEYLECSAKTGEGLYKVMATAARAALPPVPQKRSSRFRFFSSSR